MHAHKVWGWSDNFEVRNIVKISISVWATYCLLSGRPMVEYSERSENEVSLHSQCTWVAWIYSITTRTKSGNHLGCHGVLVTQKNMIETEKHYFRIMLSSNLGRIWTPHPHNFRCQKYILVRKILLRCKNVWKHLFYIEGSPEGRGRWYKWS